MRVILGVLLLMFVAHAEIKTDKKSEVKKEAVQTNINEWFEKGEKAYKAGNFQEAVTNFTKAIQIDPNDAMAYYNRGVAYADQKQYDRAIADYGKAIQIDPNYANAYNNRGIAYKNLKQYERAISDYGKAIQIDPNHANAYNNRGSAYALQQMYFAATRDARKACGLGNCKLLEVMSQIGKLRD